MPGLDDAAGIGGGPSALSRRSVLRGTAAAGAAGVAAASLIGGVLPAAASTRAAAGPARGDGTARGASSEPVVVHVRDAASGEMDVFRGTAHTRVHDKELAARLIAASG
jgi:hypothetical protein